LHVFQMLRIYPQKKQTEVCFFIDYEINNLSLFKE
jgi:hypothetical protein